MVRVLISLFFLFELFLSVNGEARPLKKNYAAPHVPSQLIIKFKNDRSTLARNIFLQHTNAKVIQRFESNGAVLMQFPQGFMEDSAEGLKRMIDKISSQPEVEYVEPNWLLKALVKEPNDPRYDELYALRKSRSRTADIGAQEAWTKTTGSRDVLVAVIDSGVDYNHEDLKDNYWHNPGENGVDANGKNKKNNGIYDDNNGMVDDWGGWNFIKNSNDPMDDNYHGTHCAGTVGASGNNGIGVVGVNWNVSIVGLKFLDSEGNGTLADAVSAIEYANKIGVDVMSNSWGGDEYSETMAAAIRHAKDAGILFVVAAGNNSSNNDVSLDYPAAYNIENIISVAATDSEGELASFSNYGAKTVHIAAPGAQILSTFPGNNYEVLDGTSMAAPLVAGAAALIKARFPHLDARQLKARLLGSAIHTKALEGWVVTGLMNINEALSDDQNPPSAVNSALVLSNGLNSVVLEFEPSIDSGSQKYAYGYEIRRSTNAVISEADWNSAQTIGVTVLEQTPKKMTVRAENLPINSSGYLSIRAYDRFGNLSMISAPVPYTSQRATTVFENKNNVLDKFSIEGSWGTEVIGNKGTVLSDSPGEVSGYNKTSTLTLPFLVIRSKDVVLTFKSNYQFELGYDFGYVEISDDKGDTWKTVAQFNGAQDWTEYTYSLSPFINEKSSSIRVRFRVSTDSTHSMDGWLLSEVVVYN